jgi:hypothetical protein
MSAPESKAATSVQTFPSRGRWGFVTFIGALSCSSGTGYATQESAKRAGDHYAPLAKAPNTSAGIATGAQP